MSRIDRRCGGRTRHRPTVQKELGRSESRQAALIRV